MTSNPTQPDAHAAADTPAGVLVRRLYGLAGVRRELGRVASRSLEGHGFGVLVSIRKREQARVSDVACDLQVDLSVASRQIAALVSAGHVERRPDPADRRAHVLEITPDGLAALRAAFLDMVGLIDHALQDWTPAEVAQLSEGLERLTTSFAATTAATTDPADQEVAA